MKEIKYATLLIDYGTALRINADLSPDADINDIRRRYDKDHTESYTVSFGNGIEMDIKLCCSDFWENETGNPLWTEAVLFKDGREIGSSAPDDRFLGRWEVEADNVVYSVDVIQTAPSTSELLKFMDRQKLYSKDELLASLEEDGNNEQALIKCLSCADPLIRNAYWHFPLCDGENIGAYLVLVKEGVLYLPYNNVTAHEYEQFDIDKAVLLSAEEIKDLMGTWNDYAEDTDNAFQVMISLSGTSVQEDCKPEAEELTKTLKFEGYSDDTFGEYGVTNEDVDNCASLNPIQCLIEAEGEKLLVVGQYAKGHINGSCWVIGVSRVDEGTPLPNWPIRLVNGECPYSPTLEIDVPSDFALTWFSNQKKVK